MKTPKLGHLMIISYVILILIFAGIAAIGQPTYANTVETGTCSINVQCNGGWEFLYDTPYQAWLLETGTGNFTLNVTAINGGAWYVAVNVPQNDQSVSYPITVSLTSSTGQVIVSQTSSGDVINLIAHMNNLIRYDRITLRGSHPLFLFLS